MNHPSAKGIEEDISEWLRGEVCAEIEDLIASPIIDPGHSDAENHAYLSWFVKHFVSSDPASTLIGDETLFADGSSDAGIDIFVEQHVDDESRFDVYQVSRPALDKLRAGSRSRRQAKIASDLRQLRNSLTERKLKKRRYNTTAVNALAKINRAIEVAQESSGRVVVINVRPMTLNKVSLEDLEEMRLLQTEAQEEWSTEKVKWTIHEVRDAEILHAEHKRRTHSKKLPDRLKLHYEDQVACAARSKGPYLGFVKAIDVIDAYEKWGPALLDSNLRYSLRTSRNNTNVNARIAQELERVAGFKRFHVKNNGLVMTCNECIIHDKAKYLELVEPQLINGGQTIDTLHHAHRELAAIPEAKRTSEERERLICYNSLLLPIKVVRTDQKLDSDTIAIASNTQNELSPRTMLSSRPEMTALRRSMANIIPHPWYCETKDGEWEAVSVGKKEYFQSRTGGKSARDFRTGGGLVRRVSNVDLGVSLLAFLGFVDKAKASFLFQADAFDRVFGSNPSNESWPVLTKKRLEWGGQELVSLFDDSRADAPLLLLAWFSWEFWRKWTFTETGQKIGSPPS